MKTVALFPGQGSQHVGMGKDLYQQFPVARETFEEASDALSVDLKRLCFDGPESDLTRTENTQPCLLTAAVAAFRVAEKELEYRPSATAGHSLGEYSALVAAGALPFAPAVQWVRARGLAMQKAVPLNQGAMTALLGMTEQDTKALCELATRKASEARGSSSSEENSFEVEALVEPANFNSPEQTVIAGSKDAIEIAAQLLSTRPEWNRVKAIPLPVSAPFHCSLMKPARETMAELFSQLPQTSLPRSLNCPYVPNVTGRMSSEHSTILELLIRQIDHPVLWKHSVEALLQSEFTRFIEFGPGKVLSGLLKRIAAPLKVSAESAQMNCAANLSAMESFIQGARA